MTLNATAGLDLAGLWKWPPGNGATPTGPRPGDQASAQASTESLELPHRQALSRELHDRIAHSIAVGLNCLDLSDFYATNGCPERARAKRADAEKGLRQALKAAKDLATQLRMPGAAPRRALHRPGGAGHVDMGEVYLILREAVGNALTHAEAEDITISLRTERNTMVAQVSDDGSGVSVTAPEEYAGVGLRSMRERVALMGGSFRMAAAPGGGTCITVTVPLEGGR